jgi:hypothetical protein
MRLTTTAILAVAILAGCRGTEGNGAANNSAGNAASTNAQGAVTTPPPGAEGAIFAEYDRACRNLTDVEALKTAAAGNGWEEFEPEADSHAGRLLAFAETNVRPLLQGAPFNNATYRKTAGGRELVLIVTEIPEGPAQSSECRVYDFNAAQPPSEAAIGTWTSNQPTNRVSQQGLTLWEWTPGFRDGLSQQTVVHMHPDSPMRQQIPAIGLAITATHGAASRE